MKRHCRDAPVYSRSLPVRAQIEQACRKPGGGRIDVRQFLKIAAGTCLLLAAPAAGAADVVPSERVTRNVVVRAAPTTQSQALDALDPGEALPFDADLPGWYRVRLPDGSA